MQYSKPKSIKDYEIVKELGKGAYGVAYLVKKKEENKQLVLKAIRIKEMKLRNQRASFREVSILKSLDHPNIIKYENSFYDEENLYIIMEYAERGDLYNLIKTKKQRRTEFSQQEIWKMASDLISALDYLHGKLIIHRDIKTLNIFITSNGTLKLGDLGVSKVLNDQSMQQTRIGTPLYLAPELIKHQTYDFKADIWGLGVILYLVATMQHPFMGKNIISLGQSIVRDKPRPLPTKYSSSLKKLIFQLLQKDPKKRPSCDNLLRNYSQFSESKPKSNGNTMEFKSFKEFKQKTFSIKEEQIATNRYQKGSKKTPSRPVLDFQPTCAQELPKTKKVDNFIQTYKPIPSQKRKKLIHNIEPIYQFQEDIKVIKADFKPQIFIPQPCTIQPFKQVVQQAPKQTESLKQIIPITPKPKEMNDFHIITPASTMLCNKTNRRPMSAVVTKVANSDKKSCNITLRDLLRYKNNTEFQNSRLASHEAEPNIAPIEVQWADEPTPINRIRPSSGTVVGRYYKVKPSTQKSTVLSKSFTKPKCPTIQLVRPSVFIMDFCRKIDS